VPNVLSLCLLRHEPFRWSIKRGKIPSENSEHQRQNEKKRKKEKKKMIINPFFLFGCCFDRANAY